MIKSHLLVDVSARQCEFGIPNLPAATAFDELHCKLGHAVQIGPGLQPQSPKNGSFSNVCPRLSAISLREWPKSEPRDSWVIRKSPPLAGLSPSDRDIFSARRTGWLGQADSNLRMVESESAIRMSHIGFAAQQ